MIVLTCSASVAVGSSWERFSMDTTMLSRPAELNRESAALVGTSHDIRRTIGRAWIAIAASGERIRRALSVHHSQVSYRKAGAGAVANAAIEVAALEKGGIQTDPLFDALECVQLAARGPVNLTAQIRAEAEADAAEDVAAAEFHTGIPGARERWAEALIRQSRESRRQAQALLAGGNR
jgi:hypothetical protein